MGLTATAILVGVVLRWFHLSQLSLWWDEGFTAWSSSLTLSEICRFAQNDVSPPLYYMLEKASVHLFGNSEFGLRAMSAFFGTLSIPAFCFLARKVLKNNFAVALGTWLFAISLVQIGYSREARTYEVASFFSLMALCALILFLENRSAASFVTVVLSVGATLYMHNMMFFYLLALNLTWLIYPSERAWTERVKEVLVADILEGILYLPWAHSLFTQVLRVHGGYWIPKPTLLALSNTLISFAGFDLDYLWAVGLRFLPLPSHTVGTLTVVAVSLLCAAMLAGGLWRLPKQDKLRNVSLLLYCFIPVLTVFIMSRVTRPLFIDRVFISSSTVLPILLAYPLGRQNQAKWRLLYGILGVVLATTTALSAFGYLRYRQKEDWRGVTQTLLSTQQPKRLIVFAPAYGETVFDYYKQRLGIAKLNVPKIGIATERKGLFMGLGDITSLRLVVESREYAEIDLVLVYEDSVDPKRVVFTYLNGAFARHEELRFYGIKVLRFLAPQR